MPSDEWHEGKLVEVESRTWPGINKPGGCARIIKVNYATDEVGKRFVKSLDVKYVVNNGCEKNVDPLVILPYQELAPRGRRRRGRDFFVPDNKATANDDAGSNTADKKKSNTNASAGANGRSNRRKADSGAANSRRSLAGRAAIVVPLDDADDMEEEMKVQPNRTRSNKSTRNKKRTSSESRQRSRCTKRTKSTAATSAVRTMDDSVSQPTRQSSNDDGNAKAGRSKTARSRSTNIRKASNKSTSAPPTTSALIPGANPDQLHQKSQGIQAVTPVPSIVTLVQSLEVSPLEPAEYVAPVEVEPSAKRGLFVDPNDAKVKPADHDSKHADRGNSKRAASKERSAQHQPSKTATLSHSQTQQSHSSGKRLSPSRSQEVGRASKHPSALPQQQSAPQNKAKADRNSGKPWANQSGAKLPVASKLRSRQSHTIAHRSTEILNHAPSQSAITSQSARSPRTSSCKSVTVPSYSNRGMRSVKPSSNKYGTKVGSRRSQPGGGVIHVPGTKSNAKSKARLVAKPNAKMQAVDRTGSIVDVASAKASRRPLQSVYEQELLKARNFMAEISGPREEDRIHSSTYSACTPVSQTPRWRGNARPQTKVKADPAERSPNHKSQEEGAQFGSRAHQRSAAQKVQKSLRYEQFLAIFQSLRESRFEDEMMEETDFKTATNEVTKTTTFTDGEIDEHLKRLVSEGKIVQSDGCIFLV